VTSSRGSFSFDNPHDDVTRLGTGAARVGPVADVALLLVLVTSFALGLTAHAAIAWGLAFARPWWRAPVALVLAPLAPVLAVRARLYVRAAVWLAAWLIYAGARIVTHARG
jgi:hypothetical protein